MRRICEDPNLKVIVLRVRNARHLDASCLMALDELHRLIQSMHRHLIVCGVREDTLRVFETSGMIQKIGRHNVFMESAENPVLSTAQAIRRAKEILGDKDARVTLYVDKSGRRKKKRIDS